MRRYFDDDDAEADEPRRDTELTLGVGGVLGAIFALLVVCLVCFAWGYSVGHRNFARSAAATSTAAPDQEPLQGNDQIPKPSAADTATPQTDDSVTAPNGGAPAAAEGANSSAAGQSAASNGQAPGMAAPGTPQVQPAPVGAAGNTAATAQAEAPPGVHAALPSQEQFMVQIAAVANTADANVLETALRNRGYTVTSLRDPADGMIHVRIGPFAGRDEANRWANKLLGDGYNAQVQP